MGVCRDLQLSSGEEKVIQQSMYERQVLVLVYAIAGEQTAHESQVPW